MLKAVSFAILVLLATPAFAGTAEDVDQAIAADLGGDGFHEAFDAIQQAVSDDDAATLAEWVDFPVAVRVGGTQETIEDAEAFVAAYPDLFTDAIKAAVTGQPYRDLFVNSQGIMFFDGQVWTPGVCTTDACEAMRWRIITIEEAAN